MEAPPRSPQSPRLWWRPLQGADLASLSALERRWGDGLPERQRRRYWQSRAALRQQLAVELGCEAMRVPLDSPPGRPPRLPEGWGWTSLSHSDGPRGEGLLLGYSPQPIGVDLEPAGRPLAADGLMRRFYPMAEQAQLQGLVGEELRAAVLTSWVLKEAAIKWRQRTLAEDLSQWWYDHSTERLRHLGDGAQPSGCSGLHAGWRWAAVGDGCAQLTVHRPASLCSAPSPLEQD